MTGVSTMCMLREACLVTPTFRTNGNHVHRDMSMNVLKGKADFVEVLQFLRLGTDLYYDFLNTGFKLTASAGSDVPWGGTIGEVRLYAYVGRNTFSADAWFEAVRAGRTFVTNGPMIEFRVEGALPGDEVKLARHEKGRQLRVKARAWGNAGRMLPVELEIIRHGEVIRKVTPDRDSQSELALDFEVDAGFGFWIAARAKGSDGSQAHTTPVYVVQEPLRFWKHEAAQELIASRLESLAARGGSTFSELRWYPRVEAAKGSLSWVFRAKQPESVRTGP